MFQEPQAALNPLMNVERLMKETLLAHQQLEHKEVKRIIAERLIQVGLTPVSSIYHRMPHQLSGGQRQRLLLATCLLLNPSVLIIDEPTSSLDPIKTQEITKLLKEIIQINRLTVICISHDLNFIAQLANKVMVLNQGQVVERGELSQILSNPRNQYTRQLWEAMQ
jgi:ABC-type glutathione transport system ATPase component